MPIIVCSSLDDSVDQAIWERHLSTLPPSLRHRISRFHHANDRHARILSMWLLQKVLALHGVPQAGFPQLAYSSTGRPYFAQLNHLDFNLSHSGDLVVCVLTEGGRVGIDVERIRELDVTEFRGVFSAGAWRDISQSDQPLFTFFQRWTQLESIAKAEGYGLGGPVQSIQLNGQTARTPDHEWHVTCLPLKAGYACHLATDKPAHNPTVNWYSIASSDTR